MSAREIKVTNTSASSASEILGNGLKSPFRFLGGSFPGTNGTCSKTLAAGASCTIVVVFQPRIEGLTKDSFLLSYFDGYQGQAASLDLIEYGEEK